ncbi:tail fiber assembly protein [Kosakonia sp. ML.JS2a]|uniref:tail fiber assembly protein n=1 Tax=Kosakonia sp. ML.JS2a TaxID=2980557 RepID=UPI0021D93FD2|nr:tail fiber assembly protein [Kosakonia sp. ML.JS2a]UXY12110.1 tail fiber assembly protein [Kosakonia sp. ML.JS2a]
MSQATLNQNLIATAAGEITVYNFSGDTREYLSTSVEYLAVGVGIPGNSTVEAPLAAKNGFAVCCAADARSWLYVADHRGETVYDLESGVETSVTTLGDYPANVTTLAPATPYDKWNGSTWVTDSTAQHDAQIASAEQKKTQLLNAAKNTISLWQTALQLGRLSEANKARLIAWMDYIDAVQAIDSAQAPDINWPAQPE